MRIKNIFTIPDGEKVTEKALRRVLVSCICSMLLCMTCLVGTTWALFTVELNNTDNVISIGNWSLEVTVTRKASGEPEAAEAAEENSQEQPGQIDPTDGKYLLEPGMYDIKLRFSSDGAFGVDAPVYVIMKQTFDGEAESSYSHAVLTYSESDNVWTAGQIRYTADKPVELVFWVTRSNSSGEVLEAEAEETTEPTDETTEATEETTEATEPSAETTEPTMEATEPSTEATEPSTEATEPSAETTEPSTEATEPSTEATEPSTEATEPSTEATDPSAEATEPSSETTEPSTEATAEPTDVPGSISDNGNGTEETDNTTAATEVTME